MARWNLSKALSLFQKIRNLCSTFSWHICVVYLSYMRFNFFVSQHGLLGKSVPVVKMNVTVKPSESKSEPRSEHLPYTFVVVATVCTCMFLVVLVVFSIVRHTTLSKRQRNSIVTRAPTRIHIRTQNRRYRTRRHHHHRNHRGHVVIQGARQTVSGFFEGNVAPPPYSAVLDDNESVRAGDPPPPYRPPSCMALGVIV